MPKAVDHWTWSEMSFQEWRDAADRRLKDIYLIDFNDAGVDDGYLISHWEDKQSPWDFVEWYAIKYDLDPKSAVWL